MIRRLVSKQTVLYICLLAPLLFSIVRKLVPGQPSWIEVLSPVIICIVFFFTFKSHVKLPYSIKLPLFVIIGLFSVYALLSITQDPMIGLASFFTRIAPIFLVFIFYKLICNELQVIRIAKLFSWLTILLLPMAIIGVLFGNDFLPAAFSPIDAIILDNREVRHGFRSVSTVFTTHWTMSWSIVGILGILGFSLVAFKQTSSEKILISLGIITSVILIYLTMRRGALAVGLLTVLFIYLKSINVKALLSLLMAAITFYFVVLFFDMAMQNGENLLMSDAILRLGDVKLNHRFNLIFWSFFSFWLDIYPFGSFLGAAGPEGRGLGFLLHEIHQSAIEVGGAQLVAEIGIISTIIFIFSILFIMYVQFYNSRRTSISKATRVLLAMQFGLIFMYFFKDMLVFTNPHMGNYIFWASIGIVMKSIRLVKLSSPVLVQKN